jgi:hypothetical protein
MRKTLVIFSSLFISFACAQEEYKIKLRSVDFGFGVFQMINKTNYGQASSPPSGLSATISISSEINKNLISASALAGVEICIFCGGEYRFNEIRLQYGREFKPSDKVILDLYAGIGRFSIARSGNYTFEESNISFPISGNMKFYFNRLFGMGLNLNYSINEISNNFSSHLIFTFRFNQ